MSDNCPLCELRQMTKWYWEDHRIVILNCVTCRTLMVVIRQHIQEPSELTRKYAIQRLSDTANHIYGKNDWELDTEQRTIKDHWHAHARPL